MAASKVAISAELKAVSRAVQSVERMAVLRAKKLVAPKAEKRAV